MSTFDVAISAKLHRTEDSLIHRVLFQGLADSPGLTCRYLQEATPSVTPQQIQGLGALVQSNVRVDRATFQDGADSLAFICLLSLGYDYVDLDACTMAGVAVTRARYSSVHTVASGAFLLMLALSKRLPLKERLVRGGQWGFNSQTWGHDLAGKTLGIVGLGDIGREVVRLVQPFGMTVIASDPFLESEVFADLGVEATELDDLLARADLVSLHCDLNETSRGLIGERELRRMKPEAYLVNTSRGPVVVQQALARALQEGWIAGAAIDVYEEEPLPLDDPLLQLDNVILTPHTVGQTEESVTRACETVLNQVLTAARGETPPHLVNTTVLESQAFQGKLARLRQQR